MRSGILATLMLLLVALLAAGVGCEAGGGSVAESDGDDDDDDDNDDDGVAGDADADGDGDGDGDGDSDTSSEVCDEDAFNIEPTPVSLMILLDASSSMVTNTTTPPNRWDEAVAAISFVLDNWTNPYIRYGIDIFPDGSQWPDYGTIADCGVSFPVQVDCAEDNVGAVQSYVTTTDAPPEAGNMTPMWCALDNYTNPSYAPGCTGTEATPYLLLISDGSDSCGLDCNCLDTPDTCGDPAYGATAEELGQVSADLLAGGVHTFVIGFGGGVDGLKLNAIVQNGGTNFVSYIIANNEQGLINAFDQISDAIVSCTYELDINWDEVNPDEVNFYFDGEVVPYIGDDGDCDSEDGWGWANEEHTIMEFCGSYCDDLKSGDIELVEAMFGCPTYQPE